jgi:cytochrome c oxidase subunit 2
MPTLFFAGEDMKITLAAWAAAAFVAFGTAPLRYMASQTEPHRIEVTAKRFTYDPATITLKKGEPVELVLKSEDVPHGLKFSELGVDVKAKKGKPGEVEFTPEKTGDFVGKCSVFCGIGHGSMHMTMHVVE